MPGKKGIQSPMVSETACKWRKGTGMSTPKYPQIIPKVTEEEMRQWQKERDRHFLESEYTSSIVDRLQQDNNRRLEETIRMLDEGLEIANRGLERSRIH